VSETLRVDIWSDLACPWCYIGKRKFEAGAAAAGLDIAVEYHSFELAPDTPVDFDGSETDFLVSYKGMPADQVQQMLDRVSAIAASVGLDYHFERVRHTNTRLAHEALHHAKTHGRQRELKERLLSAYFTEGRHIGREDELAALAAEVGLDAEATLAALRSGQYRAAVDADVEQARRYGISGVPFFVIDAKYGIAGAQDATVFTEALRRYSPNT
jgi:predicted DsbA family dithiol-disulfide isomerase